MKNLLEEEIQNCINKIDYYKKMVVGYELGRQMNLRQFYKGRLGQSYVMLRVLKKLNDSIEATPKGEAD